LTDVVFVFEAHQPHRLKRNFFWENKIFKRVKKEELFDYYFDKAVNREVFERACKKCYFPSNQILLDLIDKYKRDKKQVKVSFSISGVFLEQCEMFNKDLLESFRQLAETNCVEFLSQTYYHSLASLYPARADFIEQVEMHQQAMKDLLNYVPNVFENTELLYNNAIAKTIEKLGYKGIFTEGVERILHEKSPNYLYNPKDCKMIKVLLRNYKLTDDIGFRFSARWWSEWPLTADKYASWLASTPGQCINIFPDYETFGEHHWPETGIHEFLGHLPREILKWWHLHMATPSEVIEKFASVGEIDVPELGGTVSWADLERDASCWLGNTMQWAYYTTVRKLEPPVKEMDDKEFLRIWRYFQTSDHLYYMFTAGGAPGEVRKQQYWTLKTE
jgi:alpha-amylase